MTHMYDITEALRETLANGTRTEREDALSRLGDLAPPGAAAWVIPMLRDTESSVRVDAIVCLRELRDPIGIPSLIDVMTSGNTQEESEFAALSLSVFTDSRVRSALLTSLSDSRSSNILRMRIVLQLWRYPDTEVVAALQTAVLNDPDRNVRSHSAASLLFIFRLWNSPADWTEFWQLASGDSEVGVSQFADRALAGLAEKEDRSES